MPALSEDIRTELQRKMDAILSSSSTPLSSETPRRARRSAALDSGASRDPETSRDSENPHDSEAPRDSQTSCDPKTSGDSETSCDPDEAYRKLLAFVSLRERSCAQARERLMASGFTEKASLQAVERARACGLLDDARFADVLIRSRLAQGRGSCCIARELVENAIDPDSIPGWPDEYPCTFDDELVRALNLLERKPPTAKNKREAAYRRLVQKGFPSAVAVQASRTWYEGFCGDF